MISLNGSLELLDWEAVFFEVLVDGLEEGFGHVRFSVENPEIVVVGAADD